MKKILILIIAIIAISFIDLNAGITINVDKSGGQLNGVWPFRWVGYERVKQTVSTNSLECTGEGNITCSVTGPDAPLVNDLIDHADLKIEEDNVLNGSYNNNIYYNGTYYYRTVTWSVDGQGGDGYINVDVNEAP